MTDRITTLTFEELRAINDPDTFTKAMQQYAHDYCLAGADDPGIPDMVAAEAADPGLLQRLAECLVQHGGKVERETTPDTLPATGPMEGEVMPPAPALDTLAREINLLADTMQMSKAHRAHLIGQKLQEARDQFRADQEFGAWRAKHIPGITAADGSRYMKLARLPLEVVEGLGYTHAMRLPVAEVDALVAKEKDVDQIKAERSRGEYATAAAKATERAEAAEAKVRELEERLAALEAQKAQPQAPTKRTVSHSEGTPVNPATLALVTGWMSNQGALAAPADVLEAIAQIVRMTGAASDPLDRPARKEKKADPDQQAYLAELDGLEGL